MPSIQSASPERPKPGWVGAHTVKCSAARSTHRVKPRLPPAPWRTSSGAPRPPIHVWTSIPPTRTVSSRAGIGRASARQEFGGRDARAEARGEMIRVELDADGVVAEGRRLHPRVALLGRWEVVDLQLHAVAVGVAIVHGRGGPVIHAEERAHAAVREPRIGVDELAQ